MQRLLNIEKAKRANPRGLGTTDFSPHRKQNDTVEAMSVRKELERLGLKAKVFRDRKYRNPNGDDDDEEENEDYDDYD